MRKELDELLCTTYPEIFKNRNNRGSRSPIMFGIECGSGWYNLIDHVCATFMLPVKALKEDIERREEYLKLDHSTFSEWTLQEYTQEKLDAKKQELKETIAKIPVAVQVKEKFGGLRFYVTNATKEQENVIKFAESISHRICEECGTMDTATTYRMKWNRTLCLKHANEIYGESEVNAYHERMGKQ